MYIIIQIYFNRCKYAYNNLFAYLENFPENISVCVITSGSIIYRSVENYGLSV